MRSSPGRRSATPSPASPPDAGVPFQGLWLDAAPRVLEQRVTGRRNNVSDATPEVVRLQLDYDLGVIDWVRLDSSGEGDETLKAALAVLDRETPVA